MMEIRKMQDCDLAEVAAIEKKLFSQPWSEGGFRSSLEQKETVYLVCRVDGLVTGYCGYLQSFDEADVTNVAVAPEYQCRGIGYAMLTRLMEIGRENGIERFTLEVRESNASAIRLYEKLGFASVGKRKRFYSQPVEDAVIMWTGTSSCQ